MPSPGTLLAATMSFPASRRAIGPIVTSDGGPLKPMQILGPGAELDVLTLRLLHSWGLDDRDTDDGGLVRSGQRGGEYDLLNRAGTPLSGQELQD